MAITTQRSRGKRQDATDTAIPDEPDLAAVVDVLARFTAKLIVHVSGINTRTSASFRQIAIQELHLGTQADVDVIEAWLTRHSGG